MFWRDRPRLRIVPWFWRDGKGGGTQGIALRDRHGVHAHLTAAEAYDFARQLVEAADNLSDLSTSPGQGKSRDTL
jgi:hypothetical protein